MSYHEKQGLPRKVVVVGAGLTGLAMAWKLAQAGVPVEVIEKEPILGGMAATVRHDGFLFDYGGHRFITRNQQVLAAIQELLGDEFKPRYRKTQILLQGRYFQYPLELGDLVRHMPPFTMLGAFADYLLTVARNRVVHQPEDSFEGWTVKRFGRSLYRLYFGEYTEKVWGMSPARLSAEWASQRISLLNLWDVLFRLFIKTQEQPKTYTRQYYYPDLGIGRIAQRMGEEIQRQGGKLHLGAPVKEVTFAGNRVQSAIFLQGGARHTVDCDFLVWTAPLPHLIFACRPAADGSLVEEARALRFRGILFLFVLVDADKVTDNDALYIPEKKYLFFRIEQFKLWSQQMAPPGKTSLCLEISCNEGDEIWRADPQQLYQRALDDLVRAGLLRDGRAVEGYFIGRLAHAYPVFELGYELHAARLRAFVSSLPNLVAIGRQGLFKYIHMHHCIEMGLAAAEHIIAGKPKSQLAKIASEGDYFG